MKRIKIYCTLIAAGMTLISLASHAEERPIDISTYTFSTGEELEPLSREHYRQRVVDYSNQIKMSRENIAAAKFKIKKVKTGYYPSLGASAEASYLTNQPMKITGFSIKDYNYSAQLAIQQNVYTGNSVSNQTRAAKIEHSIAEIREDLTIENVIYSADLTYWSLSANQQQREFSRIYVQIVDSLYRIVRTRLEEGYVSRTDLLMVETRLNEARLQEISSDKHYQSSLRSLNTLMGNLQMQTFMATDTIAQPVEIPSKESLSYVLTMRPDYLIAEKQVDLSNQNIRLARSEYNPNFVVGFQGNYGTPQINTTGDGVLYGLAYAQLNVPIFRWNERRHSVNMARSAARSSQWSLLDTENQVNGELQIAYSDMEKNFEQVQVAQANLDVSMDNLILNTFSYSEGSLPILDVLSAQTAWILSYTSFVNSNYSYKVSIAEYQKALGTLSK